MDNVKRENGCGVHICSIELEIEKAENQDRQDNAVNPNNRR